jgi:AraC-like DNA-binding protein
MKFTEGFIIDNLYFSVILLAVIVFFDVLLKFKSPLQLKFYFLLTVLCVAAPSVFSFLASGPDQFVLQILIAKGLGVISMVQIFTLLYFQKYKNAVIAYSIYTLIYLLLLSYFSLTDESIIPKYNTITNVMDQREFDFTLPVFGKTLSYISLISSSFIFLTYVYFILFKYSFNNIYFKKIQNWTVAFFFFIIFMLVGYFISLFFIRTNPIFHYISIGAALYMLLLILYRPGFINKNGFRISFGRVFNRTPINEISTELFEFHFFSHFYFKNKEASIADFANVMGVSKELMLNHVYQTYSMSFDELVNKNRIEYFVEIIKDPKFKNYTVEALALEVGFTSRQRFYQPFKKFHGGNPSDLIDIVSN